MELSRARIFRWIGSGGLLLLYGLASAGQVVALWQTLSQGLPDALKMATAASQVATVGFLGLQFGLILVRRPAQQSAHGVAPFVATWVCVAAPALFVALPRAAPNAGLQLASLTVVTLGMAASIYVLVYLGRCFSILPQARGLVTSGPYARLRHPLYAAEMIATAGVMLQFAQPWALGLYIVTAVALAPRMGFEEAVLRKTFPAYGDYMRRSWRLIPGLY
jgi:protein-S-isoprenylcysteine O-methyltransferase Ste14